MYLDGIRSVLTTLLNQLQALCTMTNFDVFLSSAKQKDQVKAALSLVRGVCKLENPNQDCTAFYGSLLPLLLPLFQRTRVHEDLRTLLLHVVEDLSSELWMMTPETNVLFGQVMLQIVTEITRYLPTNEGQVKKGSDGIVKTLTLVFKCLLSAVTMSVLSNHAEWEGCMVASLLKAIQAIPPRMTYFPLLMKTVFESTTMMMKNYVGGFDMQSLEAINGYFEFMITSMDRYE